MASSWHGLCEIILLFINRLKIEVHTSGYLQILVLFIDEDNWFKI